jgi:uncharacterized protein YjbJ (UPF0337 family)
MTGKYHEIKGKMTLNMGEVIKGKYQQRVGKVRQKLEKAKASIP